MVLLDIFLAPLFLPQIPNRLISIIDFVIYFLFIVGALIIVPSFKKEPKNFVGRFIVLTTVQMLSVLAVFAAIVFVQMPHYRVLVLHALVVFVVLMVYQSVLLVKQLKKKE